MVNILGLKYQDSDLLWQNNGLKRGACSKSYELVFSKDLDLNFVDDNSVDVVWVLSVFNHMPDDVFEATLFALQRKVKTGGLVFAYFCIDAGSARKSVKFFRVTKPK